MKVYRLYRKQNLSIAPESCWEFFATPKNLGRITPGWMKFRILHVSGSVDSMYEGQIIQYKVNIFPKIPVHWTTEITHVEPQEMFVDEQRSGPYKLWHHRHHFREIRGGTEMTDEVRYALPLGFAGRAIHRLLVEKQLKSIFDYRKNVLNELFN